MPQSCRHLSRPGGITAQGRFDGIKVLIAPEYSNQTGISLGAALAGMLGENAAVGLVLTGGEASSRAVNWFFQFEPS